jgi:hypothetical protein
MDNDDYTLGKYGYFIEALCNIWNLAYVVSGLLLQLVVEELNHNETALWSI